MKKLGVIVLLSVFLFGFIGSFVSAQNQEFLKPLADNAKYFYDTVFEPFGKFLLGKNTDNGELFFAKLLFFIILVSLVNYALSQFGPTKSKSWIISAAVAILAVRWITPTWIETVVLPYSALGIALTAFFPFVLFFFFVEKSLAGHTTMRKIAWIFAAVVFVGLFFYRADLSGLYSGDKKVEFNPAIIYLITAGLCLIMLFTDKTIQNAFATAKASADSDLRKAQAQIKLDDRYIKATINRHEAGFDPKVANIEITDIQKLAKGIPGAKQKYALIPEK